MNDGNSLLSIKTPRGHPVTFEVRDGTSDHNSVWSCSQEDEYGLRDVTLGPGEWAIDVGAHIGGVAIAVLLDNPEAHCVAIEPVPDNVALLRMNAERNGVADRLDVIAGAAAAPRTQRVTVAWDFAGGVSAEHHRYVGNVANIPFERCRTEEVDAISLPWLIRRIGGPVAFAKIDCEGGEYAFLGTRSVISVARITGEYHAGWEPLVKLLERTHDVQRTSGTAGLGGFVAVRKGDR